MMRSLVLTLLLCVACLTGGGVSAAPLPRTASGYPLRPIILIAPANPGGGWDQLARLIQLVLIEEEIVPVSVQVVNRGGAGGTIGLAELAGRSRNDEHTIMIAGAVMVGAVVAHNSPFGLEDTTPIARLTGEYLAVAVPPDSPHATIADLMRAFAAAPDSITWGGGSAGGTDHQIVALLGRAAGVPLKSVRYVAFAGGGEAATAVMGSQLTAMVTGYGEIQHLAKAGKVRLLATTAPDQFSPDAPPSLTSAGIDIVVSNWRGVLAPPGASAEATAWLVEAFRRLHETEAWQDILERNDWEDSFLVGDQLRAFIDAERTRAETILSELEFGSGGAGYAAVGAWTFPALIVSALVLSAVLVIRGRGGPVQAPAPGTVTEGPHEVSWSRVAITLGLLCVFPWAMNLLGYHVAAVVLLLGLGRIFGGGSLGKAVTFAVVLTLVSFVLFDSLLGVSLPAGPFLGWFR
jgi:putative tricarboxylic transport membrane protein